MILSSDSFTDKGAIPERCAFAVADAAKHVKFSDNRNPHLAWKDLPAGTKSLALVCCDSDVPCKPDDVMDVQICPVGESFRGAELLQAIQPHVLGSARITGVYSLNPAVKT